MDYNLYFLLNIDGRGNKYYDLGRRYYTHGMKKCKTFGTGGII
jgi:hypothetical protein